MAYQRPIICVTGANSGVGFGTCHRLLLQLSQKSPPDARPQVDDFIMREDAPSLPCEGLTLILACRSVKRAEEARTKLLAILDRELARRKRSGEDDGHGEVFRRNLQIEIHYVDMASISTILHFGHELAQKYPYVSHLICNAGVASYAGIDWLKAVAQLATSPMAAVTSPQFNYQNVGETSADGLGWVWQCNVFGHYVLYRTLTPLLSQTPRSALGPARVLWTTSVEASPFHYAEFPGDWQLLRTGYSYECSKYQCDLIATQLEMRALSESANPPIRHFPIEPGVASTNIAKALIGKALDYVKICLFFVARWLGSPHHTITSYNAAVAGVHMALLPLALIPAYISAFSTDNKSKTRPTAYKPSVTRPPSDGHANGSAKASAPPVRFGSETDRSGRARVGLTAVQEWEKNAAHSAELVDKCEELYQSFVKTGGKGPAP